jgi:hypothetical protein
LVHGRNVSATKVSGQNIFGPKRIPYKKYRLQNVSMTKRISRQIIGYKTYRQTKRIGGQNVLTTKRIVYKTYRQTIFIADHKKCEIMSKKSFINFKVRCRLQNMSADKTYRRLNVLEVKVLLGHITHINWRILYSTLSRIINTKLSRKN